MLGRRSWDYIHQGFYYYAGEAVFQVKGAQSGNFWRLIKHTTPDPGEYQLHRLSEIHYRCPDLDEVVGVSGRQEWGLQ